MLFEKMTLLFSGVSVLRVRVQPDVAGAAAGDARLLPRHHPPHLPQVAPLRHHQRDRGRLREPHLRRHREGQDQDRQDHGHPGAGLRPLLDTLQPHVCLVGGQLEVS